MTFHTCDSDTPRKDMVGGFLALLDYTERPCPKEERNISDGLLVVGRAGTVGTAYSIRR